MRKPVSKHALRRALNKVREEGGLEWTEPDGAVVDRIWHELGRERYNAGRKRPVSRETVRTPPVPDTPEATPEV